MEPNDQFNNNVDDIPRIRTFQSDIADAIKNQKGSVIKIAVAEQARKTEEGVMHKTQKRKCCFIVVGLILFLFGAGIFAFYLYKEDQKKNNVVLDIPKKKNFVNGDHVTEVPIESMNVLKTVLEQAFTNVHIGVAQIEQLLPTLADTQGNKSALPLSDIFAAYDIAPGDEFMYSLASDTYLLGVYQDTKGERFILLKTNAFSNTFFQMLSYEKSFLKNGGVSLI